MKSAPASDEIEISIFGPGYGECIVIHIGANKWLIIDSCTHQPSKRPAALNYFNQINIDPSQHVDLIIASHWDDDHIRGLGRVFKECKKADFICSDALKCDEFIELIKINQKEASNGPTGVVEFGKIIDELTLRKEQKEGSGTSLKFAIADRPLWNCKYEVNSSIFECTVYSLSPSDKAVIASKKEIGNLIPKENQERNVIAPLIKTNHASVVLWVTINNFSILLGADLEEDKNPHGGWSAIIESTTRPDEKATYFKIPHHGSQNAHHPGIWETLLVPKPIATLTPFSKGSSLPTDEMINTICKNTPNAYSTAIPKLEKRLKRYNKTVDKTILETVGKNIYLKNSSFGHVRFRTKISEESNVELFGDGIHLCC